MHPVEFHASELEKLKGKVSVKKLWSDEEVARMAMVEAKLVLVGDTENINQKILKELPGRTIEAIKGKRRFQSYKKRVEDLVKVLKLDTANLVPASPGTDSLTEDVAGTSRPVGVTEELEGEYIEDPLRDLINEENEELDYHLDESTLIYECIEKYVDVLNNDARLRPLVTDTEKSLIDTALSCFEDDPNKRKELITEYLTTIIKPRVPRKSVRNNSPKPAPKLSNRKLKKKNYAEFQSRYKKKRKAAFDTLCSNNSVAEDLTHNQVLDFWSNLLCKKSVKFVGQPIPISNKV